MKNDFLEEVIASLGGKLYLSDVNKNKLIIAGNKCGTRYIKSVSSFSEIDYDYYTGITSIEKIYWIIRPPLEHFLSAVLTEHNTVMNVMNENSNKKIKVKLNEDKLKYDILSQLINDISTKPYFKINTNNSNNIFGHYYPKYEFVYNKMLTEYAFFNNVSFIELSNLSNLLKSKFNLNLLSFNNKNYTFEQYYSKDELLNLLQTDFKKNWKILLPIIENDNDYYNKILLFNQSDFLMNKIHDLYEELNVCIPLFVKYNQLEFKENMTNINEYITKLSDMNNSL
jgi:hypothetical protein